MTTKQTASASKNAQPREGEVLVYIDWQGKKLFGPTPGKAVETKEEKDV